MIKILKRLLQKSRGVMKAQIKETMAYKFEMFLTVFFGPMTLIVNYFLWKAVYANNGTAVIGGFTFEELISYYVLSWIVFIMRYNDVEDYMIHHVRSGSIVSKLIKPVNYIFNSFSATIGHRMSAMVIEVLPIFLIGVIFFHLKVTMFNLIFFLIAVMFAAVMNFFLCAAVGMTSFWIVQSRGLSRFKRILISFLSGNMIPITFFPLAFQNVSFYLPFQYLTFVPINIFIGKYAFWEMMGLLGMSLLWILIFYVIVSIIWSRAVKRVSAVGV